MDEDDDQDDSSDDGLASYTPVAAGLAGNLESGGLTGEAQAATGLVTALGQASGAPPSATSGNAQSTTGAFTSTNQFGQVTINTGAGASQTSTSTQSAGGLSLTDILIAAGTGLVLFFIFRK